MRKKNDDNLKEQEIEKNNVSKNKENEIKKLDKIEKNNIDEHKNNVENVENEKESSVKETNLFDFIPDVNLPVCEIFPDIDSKETMSKYIDKKIFEKQTCTYPFLYECEKTWTSFFILLNKKIEMSIKNCKYFTEIPNIPYSWYKNEILITISRLLIEKGYSIKYDFQKTIKTNIKEQYLILTISWDALPLDLFK